MKNNPITVGVDDSPFSFNTSQTTTQLIGVVCQGTRMVNVVRKVISVDGQDSTEQLIELIRDIEKHVRYVLTDTITFGGFNLYDMEKVFQATQKPLIAISERQVNLEAVKKALVHKFSPSVYRKKLQCILNAGNLYQTKIKTAGGVSDVFFHFKGIELSEVEDLIEKLCIDSKLPEPVRMAHLIGTIF
ncbi:MAG: DUF99 family protein [Promethearchaeota archaeon]|nr:MAG: DUF99 family protein [Candidatus Lokiarchaeota archaeon]